MMVAIKEKDERSDLIADALSKRGITRRWLIEQIILEGVGMNDSMLSNRFRGYNKWKPTEIKAINKILNLELKTE